MSNQILKGCLDDPDNISLLFERIFSCDEIKDEDKNILKLMYGKKVADRILAIE